MVWKCWCASSIFTIQLGCWVGHFSHGARGGSMSFGNRTRRFFVDRGLVGVHFVNSYTISGDDNDNDNRRTFADPLLVLKPTQIA